MKELIVYSIYDKKSETYDTPFFAFSDIMAKRHFTMLVLKKGSVISTFKDSFILKRLGTWEPITARFKILPMVDLLEGIQIKEEVKE